MNEILLNTSTLPEPLFRLIRTKTVRVNEADGVVILMPIIEENSDCPLLGIAADCGFTVAEFLEKKREEKELEGE